jgi:hypothetical protein
MASKMATNSNKHPELHYNLFNIEQWLWCQTLYVFKVKKFIEMVDYGVEGLLDNKIQDECRLKGKQQNSLLSTL